LLPKVCADQKVEEKEHFVTKKGDKLFCLVEQQSKFIAETKKKKNRNLKCGTKEFRNAFILF
jgi:superfamily II RNA helicase